MITPKNDFVILTGKVKNLSADGKTRGNYYCVFKYRTGDYIAQFADNIPVPIDLEDRKIRFVGELRIDNHGDDYFMIKDYELLTKQNKKQKSRPSGWKSEWPIKGMK